MKKIHKMSLFIELTENKCYLKATFCQICLKMFVPVCFGALITYHLTPIEGQISLMQCLSDVAFMHIGNENFVSH